MAFVISPAHVVEANYRRNLCEQFLLNHDGFLVYEVQHGTSYVPNVATFLNRNNNLNILVHSQFAAGDPHSNRNVYARINPLFTQCDCNMTQLRTCAHIPLAAQALPRVYVIDTTLYHTEKDLSECLECIRFLSRANNNIKKGLVFFNDGYPTLGRAWVRTHNENVVGLVQGSPEGDLVCISNSECLWLSKNPIVKPLLQKGRVYTFNHRYELIIISYNNLRTDNGVNYGVIQDHLIGDFPDYSVPNNAQIRRLIFSGPGGYSISNLNITSQVAVASASATEHSSNPAMAFEMQGIYLLSTFQGRNQMTTSELIPRINKLFNYDKVLETDFQTSVIQLFTPAYIKQNWYLPPFHRVLFRLLHMLTPPTSLIDTEKVIYNALDWTILVDLLTAYFLYSRVGWKVELLVMIRKILKDLIKATIINFWEITKSLPRIIGLPSVDIDKIIPQWKKQTVIMAMSNTVVKPSWKVSFELVSKMSGALMNYALIIQSAALWMAPEMTLLVTLASRRDRIVELPEVITFLLQNTGAFHREVMDKFKDHWFLGLALMEVHSERFQLYIPPVKKFYFNEVCVYCPIIEELGKFYACNNIRGMLTVFLASTTEFLLYTMDAKIYRERLLAWYFHMNTAVVYTVLHGLTWLVEYYRQPALLTSGTVLDTHVVESETRLKRNILLLPKPKTWIRTIFDYWLNSAVIDHSLNLLKVTALTSNIISHMYVNTAGLLSFKEILKNNVNTPEHPDFNMMLPKIIQIGLFCYSLWSTVQLFRKQRRILELQEDIVQLEEEKGKLEDEITEIDGDLARELDQVELLTKDLHIKNKENEDLKTRIELFQNTEQEKVELLMENKGKIEQYKQRNDTWARQYEDLTKQNRVLKDCVQRREEEVKNTLEELKLLRNELQNVRGMNELKDQIIQQKGVEFKLENVCSKFNIRGLVFIGAIMVRPGGVGKSRHWFQMLYAVKQQVVVIVPSKRMSVEGVFREFTPVTYRALEKLDVTSKIIVVDEYCRFTEEELLHIIQVVKDKCAALVILGDPRQFIYIDQTITLTGLYEEIAELDSRCDGPLIMQRGGYLLNQKVLNTFYPDMKEIKPGGNENFVVECKQFEEEDLQRFEKYTWIVDTKAEIPNINVENVVSVAQIQGDSKELVVYKPKRQWIIEELGSTQMRIVNTALTRATRHLMILGDDTWKFWIAEPEPNIQIVMKDSYQEILGYLDQEGAKRVSASDKYEMLGRIVADNLVDRLTGKIIILDLSTDSGRLIHKVSDAILKKGNVGQIEARLLNYDRKQSGLINALFSKLTRTKVMYMHSPNNPNYKYKWPQDLQLINTACDLVILDVPVNEGFTFLQLKETLQAIKKSGAKYILFKNWPTGNSGARELNPPGHIISADCHIPLWAISKTRGESYGIIDCKGNMGNMIKHTDQDSKFFKQEVRLKFKLPEEVPQLNGEWTMTEEEKPVFQATRGPTYRNGVVATQHFHVENVSLSKTDVEEVFHGIYATVPNHVFKGKPTQPKDTFWYPLGHFSDHCEHVLTFWQRMKNKLQHILNGNIKWFIFLLLITLITAPQEKKIVYQNSLYYEMKGKQHSATTYKWFKSRRIMNKECHIKNGNILNLTSEDSIKSQVHWPSLDTWKHFKIMPTIPERATFCLEERFCDPRGYRGVKLTKYVRKSLAWMRHALNDAQAAYIRMNNPIRTNNNAIFWLYAQMPFTQFLNDINLPTKFLQKDFVSTTEWLKKYPSNRARQMKLALKRWAEMRQGKTLNVLSWTVMSKWDEYLNNIVSWEKEKRARCVSMPPLWYTAFLGPMMNTIGNHMKRYLHKQNCVFFTSGADSLDIAQEMEKHIDWIFSDFGNFDGSQSYAIIDIMCNIFDNFLIGKDKPLYQLFFRLMLVSILKGVEWAIVIFGKMKSGAPMTTVMNTLLNILIWWITWNILGRPKWKLLCGGDDSMVWFDTDLEVARLTVRRVCRDFGLDIETRIGNFEDTDYYSSRIYRIKPILARVKRVEGELEYEEATIYKYQLGPECLRGCKRLAYPADCPLKIKEFVRQYVKSDSFNNYVPILGDCWNLLKNEYGEAENYSRWFKQRYMVEHRIHSAFHVELDMNWWSWKIVYRYNMTIPMMRYNPHYPDILLLLESRFGEFKSIHQNVTMILTNRDPLEFMFVEKNKVNQIRKKITKRKYTAVVSKSVNAILMRQAVEENERALRGVINLA